MNDPQADQRRPDHAGVYSIRLAGPLREAWELYSNRHGVDPSKRADFLRELIRRAIRRDKNPRELALLEREEVETKRRHQARIANLRGIASRRRARRKQT